MGLRSAVAAVVVLAAMAAWGRWGEKLDSAAVTAMCQASEDAARVERQAVRAFKDAAEANEEGAGTRVSSRSTRAFHGVSNESDGVDCSPR